MGATAAAASTTSASDGGQVSPSQPGASPVARINPDALSAPRGYSHVVIASGGRTIYVSGQVPLDRTGALVGAGDLAAQTQQVFENLRAALSAAGATFGDVVKLTYYVLDASKVQVVRDVRDTFIDASHPPASTLVEVRRLFRDDLLIEIDAIAHVK
jgi:enamine deaminase RidA (YjgF/YER057c/UK114 family)